MARGTIVKRAGTRGVAYRIVYDIEPDPATGRRRQRTETCKTKKEAETLLAKRLTEVEQGDILNNPRITVADYLDFWFTQYAGTVRFSTAHHREKSIRLYLKPALGSLRLANLKAIQIQRMYDTLGTKLAPNSILQVHSTLYKALAQAVKWGMIAKNPAATTEPPRQQRAPVQHWTGEEASRFLAATTKDRLHAAYVLGVFAHLRIGEVAALQWADFDWERSLVRIERTAMKARGPEAIGPVKTAAGKRAILVPPAALAVLKAHKAAQNARRLALGSQWGGGDWVFDRGDGRRLTTGVLRSCFNKAVAKVDVPRITFHGLRHTGGTLMLAAGVHPKIASARLGHSSISVTLDVYSHAMVEMQEAAAADLERAVSLGVVSG